MSRVVLLGGKGGPLDSPQRGDAGIKASGTGRPAHRRRLRAGGCARTHLDAAHTVADDAAKIACGAGGGMLALNHLAPVDDVRFSHEHRLARVEAVWDGPVLVGVDGMEITL